MTVLDAVLAAATVISTVCLVLSRGDVRLYRDLWQDAEGDLTEADNAAVEAHGLLDRIEEIAREAVAKGTM